MPQPSSTIVEALTGDEVCPLCLDRFSAADACSCVVCRVSSCPSCAEVLDAEGASRCFACRPAAQVPAQAAHSAAPLSLPRPIMTKQAAPAYTPGVGAARLPELPFPLTTSPQGVRSLQIKPQGSVFVGLPSVSPQLAASLSALAQPAPHAKLGRRASQKLVLLTRAVGAIGTLVVLCQRVFTRERAGALRARLGTLANALTRRAAYGRRTLTLHVRTLTLKLSALAHGLVQHAEPRLRALNARLLLARGPARSKPGVHADPSRPIRS